jgi:murein DD-endopeptidase MepM/ murein hydrolase activator NlpD
MTRNGLRSRMTDRSHVRRNSHRDGGGISRLLAIPSAFVVTVALAIGGGALAAGADELEHVADTSQASAALDAATTADVSQPADTAAAVVDTVQDSPAVSDVVDQVRAAASPDAPAPAPADPPAEQSQPADPSDPPTDSSLAPPTEPTEPPTDPTDPPADPTDPTNPPADPTDPPADPPADPTPPADPVDPPPVEAAAPAPDPEPTPIPVRRASPTPAPAAQAAARAAARAAAEAARVAAAERAAARSAAQATFTRARGAVDDAKRTFASVTAEHDAADRRAAQIHEMAADAATTALRSQRVLGALIRSLAQQGSSSATAGVLLDSPGDADLLYQLGTLDKLSELTGNVELVRARAEADQTRATDLAAQEVAAHELVLSIPLDAARADLQRAEADFDAASTALAALQSQPSVPVGMAGLTPLPELLAADTGQLSDQGWANPAVGRITDGYGPRPDRPLPGVGAFHYGTDVGAACGAGVYAATSGVVEAVGPLGTYGNWILIDHGNGIETGYAHVANGGILVSVGEPVIAGQVIAGVGSTGASTGCHLHFEVRIDGTRVDARSFMAERGVSLGDE